MLTKGDFHIHSTASDGCLSPKEILVTAKSKGIDILAITDHNSTKGIEQAAISCKQHKISIIPAVELSTRYKNESIHLLGYFKNNKYRQSTFQNALESVKAHNVKDIRKFIKSHNDPSGTSKYLSVSEGIQLLRLFGATVVLAHPVRIRKNILAEIMNLKFDGLEAKYCFSSVADTSYFIHLALDKFSFYTGGSDFHTNKKMDPKHSIIGEPCLNATEIKRFLKKSRAIILN
jgi:predicted metal-dependent phosphoesterase TrpH